MTAFHVTVQQKVCGMAGTLSGGVHLGWSELVNTLRPPQLHGLWAIAGKLGLYCAPRPWRRIRAHRGEAR